MDTTTAASHDPAVCSLLDFLITQHPAVAREAVDHLRDYASEARYSEPAVGIIAADSDAETAEALAEQFHTQARAYGVHL